MELLSRASRRPEVSQERMRLFKCIKLPNELTSIAQTRQSIEFRNTAMAVCTSSSAKRGLLRSTLPTT
jgi:hypothetical protein